jgi:hypothetical protein
MSATDGTMIREKLFQEILNALRQWPELEQNIFCEAHYFGRTPEAIACSYRLDISEVRKILKQCDRSLHASLGDFLQKFAADPAFDIIAAGNVHLTPPISLLKKNNPRALQQR